MQEYDMLIVGAGISGLSLAHYSMARGWRSAVLEQGQRVGGTLHSARFTAADGFWLELGAHSCFNSYGKLLEILEARGLLEQVQARRKVGFKMWVGGRLKSIPSQLGFLELLVSLPRLFFHKKAGRGVAEYFTPIVGAENYRRVFRHAFDAVICQAADNFPAEMLFRKKPRRKDVLKSFTFPHGVQQIADVLGQAPGLALHTGQAVVGLAWNGQRFRLTTATGEQYAAPLLALAVPAAEAARLLAGDFPDLAELLGRVRGVEVESVGIVVRKGATALPPLGGIIGVDEDFYSVVARDTVDDPRYRGFTFHFKPGKLDCSAKHRKIAEVLGVPPTQWVASAEKRNLLPVLAMGHTHLVAALDAHLAGLPLALTGNYFSGVSMEECVARSASEFARLRGLGKLT